MEMLLGIFSAFGLSASAGLNAYIPLLVVGVIGHYFPDTLKLAQPWDLIANPWILILLGVLVIIEMVADKVPAVNHINDIIQTVVRPAAGAIAFAASAKVVTDINPVLALACGLLMAGGVHVVKAAALRPAVTATTGQGGGIASRSHSHHRRRGECPGLHRGRYPRVLCIRIRCPAPHRHGQHPGHSAGTSTLVALAAHRQGANCLI